ncbi:DUF6660 family protein [Nonlabens tegetincola]|nr:DUF6660 family protein [Nonlabens tegetincola]
MKWFFILFSMYFLALNIMPCGDGVEHDDHIEIASDHDGCEDNHEDLCSPFCICNCCSVQLVFELPYITQFLFSDKTILGDNHYKSPYSIIYPDSEIDPPRVLS